MLRWLHTLTGPPAVLRFDAFAASSNQWAWPSSGDAPGSRPALDLSVLVPEFRTEGAQDH